MISTLTIAEMRLAAAQYGVAIAQLEREAESGHGHAPAEHLQHELTVQRARAADYAVLIDLAEKHNDTEAMNAVEQELVTVGDLATELGIAASYIDGCVGVLTKRDKSVWQEKGLLSPSAALEIRRMVSRASSSGSHDTCRPWECPFAP